ncbi:MAG TPA: hypothetical protein VK917_01480 [Ilumatobacter sp.]|nr:hypothetical protein [Ilumatobacter sp.]
MYDDPHYVKAIHRDRMERLRRVRNPRRGWRDDERNPRRRRRADREL